MAQVLGLGPNSLIAQVDGSVDHTLENYAANIDTSGEGELALLSRVMVKVYGRKISDGLWEVIGYIGPQADLDTVVGATELKIKGTLNVSAYDRVSLTSTGASSTLVKAQSSSGIVTGDTSGAITSIASLGTVSEGQSILGSVGSGAMTFKRLSAKSGGELAVSQAGSGNSLEVALSDNVLGMTKHQSLGNVVGTINWDAQNGNVASLTATGNLTLNAIANAVAGTYMLKIKQDATGSRTLTLGADFLKPGGAAITLSTAAAAEDVLSIFYDGTKYYIAASLNFS